MLPILDKLLFSWNSRFYTVRSLQPLASWWMNRKLLNKIFLWIRTVSMNIELNWFSHVGGRWNIAFILTGHNSIWQQCLHSTFVRLKQNVLKLVTYWKTNVASFYLSLWSLSLDIISRSQFLMSWIQSKRRNQHRAQEVCCILCFFLYMSYLNIFFWGKI